MEYSKVYCPTAASLRNKTLSLYMHPTWEEDIDICAKYLKEILKKHLVQDD